MVSNLSIYLQKLFSAWESFTTIAPNPFSFSPQSISTLLIIHSLQPPEPVIPVPTAPPEIEQLESVSNCLVHHYQIFFFLFPSILGSSTGLYIANHLCLLDCLSLSHVVDTSLSWSPCTSDGLSPSFTALSSALHTGHPPKNQPCL